MRNLRDVASILFLLLVSGCQSAILNHHLVGNYYLGAPDDMRQCMLGFRDPPNGNSYLGVVTETVFAAGFNEKYIVVKQHPNDNRAITNYFIVPIEKKVTFENVKNVLGPFTLDQFNKKKAELSIPESLKFTVVYPELQ